MNAEAMNAGIFFNSIETIAATNQKNLQRWEKCTFDCRYFENSGISRITRDFYLSVKLIHNISKIWIWYLLEFSQNSEIDYSSTENIWLMREVKLEWRTNFGKRTMFTSYNTERDHVRRWYPRNNCRSTTASMHGSNEYNFHLVIAPILGSIRVRAQYQTIATST